MGRNESGRRVCPHPWAYSRCSSKYSVISHPLPRNWTAHFSCLFPTQKLLTRWTRTRTWYTSCTCLDRTKSRPNDGHSACLSPSATIRCGAGATFDISLKAPPQSLVKKYEMDCLPIRANHIFCIFIGFVPQSLLHSFDLVHSHSAPFLWFSVLFEKARWRISDSLWVLDRQELSGCQYYRNAVWDRAVALSEMKTISKLCIPRLIPNLIVPDSFRRRSIGHLYWRKH